MFSGVQGALTVEAPRYMASMAIRDNGDGTYTVPYYLVLRRYLGSSYTADRAYDCVFVDANANSQPDADEALFGVVVESPRFSQATSSSIRYTLSVTVAAEPGSRICTRAQVDSSYNGTYQDKSQYFCETLPDAGVQLPVGAMGGLGLSALAAGAALLPRRRPRRPSWRTGKGASGVRFTAESGSWGSHDPRSFGDALRTPVRFPSRRNQRLYATKRG